jgi:bloom syndrome protein
MGCQIKRNSHEKLQLHGAGKKLSKLEVERIIHRMVIESIFREDTNKSDTFGALSSIIRVCAPKFFMHHQAYIRDMIGNPV